MAEPPPGVPWWHSRRHNAVIPTNWMDAPFRSALFCRTCSPAVAEEAPWAFLVDTTAWGDSKGPMYVSGSRVQQGFSRRLNNMALASNKPTPPLIPYAAQPLGRWLRHGKARLDQYGHS
ncbi:uncharacterized protein FPRN_07603 [Fusarium proliferatum]|nr:uncharacterized protein FPRN_07603 [Fusarium proliferatum]